MTDAADYPFPRVRIDCRKCGRGGVYRRERFAALVGPDTSLRDALSRIVADCPERQTDGAGADACGAWYPDLIDY
jgi:hypothetical protein